MVNELHFLQLKQQFRPKLSIDIIKNRVNYTSIIDMITDMEPYSQLSFDTWTPLQDFPTQDAKFWEITIHKMSDIKFTRLEASSHAATDSWLSFEYYVGIVDVADKIVWKQISIESIS